MNETDLSEDPVFALQVHMFFYGNCADGLGYPGRNYLLRHLTGQ